MDEAVKPSQILSSKHTFGTFFARLKMLSQDVHPSDTSEVLNVPCSKCPLNNPQMRKLMVMLAGAHIWIVAQENKLSWGAECEEVRSSRLLSFRISPPTKLPKSFWKNFQKELFFGQNWPKF